MLLQGQAEAYSKQHEDMLKRLTTPEKTMLVCDVCGVFINSTDNDQRRRVSACGCGCGCGCVAVLVWLCGKACHLLYAVSVSEA